MSLSQVPPVVHTSPTTSTASGDDGTSGQATASTGSSFLQGKTFVQKLHSLLNITKYSSIISWNDAGTAVIIHDVDAFISKVVPAHFKKTKFGSFVRKMRRWGFSVITKQRSPSISATSAERGQSTVMEFSSEHFLRDQPDLCRLMKDERHVKKQFSFLDVKKQASSIRQNGYQEYAIGVCVHSPLSASEANARKANALKYQAECQQQVSGSNATMNNGYPHKHGYNNSMPPMISPHQNQQSYHDAMPKMNMMMLPPSPPPPQPPQQHPYYSYGAPPSSHQAATGVGYGPPPPSFQNPSAPDGYAPYSHHHQSHHDQQQQQTMMMQQNPQQQMVMQKHPQQQQQMMQQYPPQQQQQHEQQQQYQMTKQNQQLPPPSTGYANSATASTRRELETGFAASITPNGCSGDKASTASVSAAVLWEVNF